MPPYTVHTDSDRLTVRTAELELIFSLDDGGLRGLNRPGAPSLLGYGTPLPTLDVCLVDKGWLAERMFVRHLHSDVSEDADSVIVTITSGIGPLIAHDVYRLLGTQVLRSLSLTNVAEDPVRLQAIRMIMPWLRIGDPHQCLFEAPGNQARPRVPLDIAAAQRIGILPRRFFAPGLRDGHAIEIAPTNGCGVLALHNLAINETLVCWFAGRIAPARPLLHGNDTAVSFLHEVLLEGWLNTDTTLEVGAQTLALTHQPLQQALDALRNDWEWSAPISERVTRGVPPEWLPEAAIYEVHPAACGGLQAMRKKLPELAAMGVNTLCLLPIWLSAAGAGQLWDENWYDSGNPYALRDLDQIDPLLGRAEDLSALVTAAHQQQMRVILDLPTLGCMFGAGWLSEHPEWFCTDLRGTPVRVPNQESIIAFDWTNTELQDELIRTALALIRAHDLDGFRLPTPHYHLAGWQRRLVSTQPTGMMAFMHMTGRLFEAVRQLKPDAVIIGEAGGPLSAVQHDATLDNLLNQMFLHLAFGRLTPAELSAWLSDYTHILPDVALRIGFVEGYKTHRTNPLADGLRGSRLSHMILAGLVFCGALPMVRAGMELDERAFILNLLRARARYRILRYGTVHPGVISCDIPQVFTVLRRMPNHALIGLLNTGPHRRIATLSVPEHLIGSQGAPFTLIDVFTDEPLADMHGLEWHHEDLRRIQLTLDPYSARAFYIRSGGLP